MRHLLASLLYLLPFFSTAQSVTGIVMNESQKILIGANVYWAATNIGTTTNERGIFELTTEGIATNLLVASYVGFESDTLAVSPSVSLTFQLKASQTLDQVVVTGQQDAVIISNIKTIKTEQITERSLRQAACCDLGGCFGGQSTVQPRTTNIITNAKELRILGLSGVYNQVLLDGFPLFKGLAYTYGISGIPGTLIENIYIAKGANSVLQGFDGISGQINVQTKNPRNIDKLLVNGYVNSFLEKQLNVNYAFQKGDWHSLTNVSTVQPANKIDGDQDTFLDVPLLTRYAVGNKWTYGNASEWGWNSQINARFMGVIP